MSPLGDQGAYKLQKSQTLSGPRVLQVAKGANASPLGDQGVYKSQKSLAFWVTKGITSRTPKALAQVVSPLGDLGAYMSQKSQALWGTKGLTSRISRKPFGGPRGLEVAKDAIASP